MAVETEFTQVSAAQLRQCIGRIESCVAKLTPEQVWRRAGENQNAIGNLLLHLEGNVRQWILSGVGGAPDQRDRDLEFSQREPLPPGDLVARLGATVTEAVSVIERLDAAALLQRITVQGYDVTKLAAVYHVVEHFTGHAFQIIFATKLLTGEDLGFYAHLSARP